MPSPGNIVGIGIADPCPNGLAFSKETFLKMLEGRIKIGRSAKCCNALYLYSIFGAIHDVDWRDVPNSKKIEFKIFTEKLRKSGKYGSKA